jgi:hypothetical protein
MGAVKIKGQTSGSTTITAPATGGDETIELSTALAGKLPIAGGKILQIVRATDTTNRSTTSTSLVDVTGMSVTITPQKNDSAIIIMAVFRHDATAGSVDNRAVFVITDSSNNSISGAQDGLSGIANLNAFAAYLHSLVAYSTPATLSATTYKLRFRTINASAPQQVVNNLHTGQMYAIEVSA